MSLRKIIQKKDNELQKLLNRFDKEFTSLSFEAKKEIMRLFRSGKFDTESVASAFGKHADLINDIINRYPAVVSFSKEMASELGVKFVITKETVKRFDLIQSINEQSLKNNVVSHITELSRIGLLSDLEGLTMGQVAERIAGAFDALGARLNTEIYTGMSMADSVVKRDFFQQAGIEKYYYDGPNDDKTRAVCQHTLDDPRQAAGWTMDEINSSDTPFIERGGWNCRHEWLPFIGD